MYMSIVCLVLVASVQANPVPETDAKQGLGDIVTGIYDTVQNGTDQLVDIVGGGAQFALDAAGNVYVLVTDVIGNTFTTLGDILNGVTGALPAAAEPVAAPEAAVELAADV